MIFLSGSSHGRGILIEASASPGTFLHRAPPIDSGEYDEVYLWVSNLHSAPVTLTIEWGGEGDPYDLLAKGVEIPANSPPLAIATGFPIRQALEIRAFGSIANKLQATGYCNRLAEA